MQTSRWVRAVVGAVTIATIGCGGGRAECHETRAEIAGSGPLGEFSWLAGTWVADDPEGGRTEETWAVPRGTVMLGNSHTEGPDGSTRSWETMRIERHGEVVRYVASPMGVTLETAFRAVENERGLVVFENPDHDYPQRITYSLERDGLLRATVSDIHGANQRSWLMQRDAR